MLQVHAQLSRRMSAKFSRWLTESWENANISSRQMDLFSDWLLGHVDGLKRGLSTVSHQVAAVDDQPPYRCYVKYNVVTNHVD
jgi:hypothetical protein